MSRTIALLVARLIFAGLFIMAAVFKLNGMAATATYVATAAFPVPLVLAWLAALFEGALALAFITGVFFSEAAILAAAYILFLAFSFHGPSRWSGNRDEFGFFVDHFTFIAGLLFAAVHGLVRDGRYVSALLRRDNANGRASVSQRLPTPFALARCRQSMLTLSQRARHRAGDDRGGRASRPGRMLQSPL